MTAAQKKNAERFKKAIAEAKKLRKKNPKLTQAQAVKQAWAILYKTGKVGAAKKTATKKKSVKKKVAKKSTAKSYHKDTKSHNVNIRVMSGTTISSVSGIGKEKMIKNWTDMYGRLAAEYIRANSKEKKIISKEMKIAREIIHKIKRTK